MNLLSFVKAMLVCVWILPFAIHFDSYRDKSALDPHHSGLDQALPENAITLAFDEPEFPLDTSVDGTVMTSRDGDPIPPLSFSFSAAEPVVQNLWLSPSYFQNQQAAFTAPEVKPANHESVLTFDFSEPVERVRLNYALQGLERAQGSVYRVEAYDPLGTLVGSWSRELDGTFRRFDDTMDYDSDVPFSRLQMRFDDRSFVGDRLAVSDLSFVPARGPDPTWRDTILVASIVFAMGTTLLVMRNRRLGRL